MSRLSLLLVLLVLLLPARGSGTSDEDEEVEYVRFRRTAAVGGTVALDCGSVAPTIFIWGFTKPGTDNNMALVYDYGHGSKMQTQGGDLGRVRVPVNTSTLVIEDVRPDAEGMYTCQAMYDSEDGPTVKFYYTKLDLDLD